MLWIPGCVFVGPSISVPKHSFIGDSTGSTRFYSVPRLIIRPIELGSLYSIITNMCSIDRNEHEDRLIRSRDYLLLVEGFCTLLFSSG